MGLKCTEDVLTVVESPFTKRLHCREMRTMLILIEGDKTYFDRHLVYYVENKENMEAQFILQQHKRLQYLRDSSGATLLHLSAKCANDAISSYLLFRGCKVDAKNNLGKSPLMLAVADSEDAPTIKTLLDANANIYATDIHEVSPLRMVIERSRMWLGTLRPETKHLLILEYFFERVKQDYHVDAKLTLRRLEDVVCPMALIPFMRCVEMTACLLTNKLALDERINGLTALHVAVLNQDVENVKVLVDYGADVNAVDHRGQTPLFACNTQLPDSNFRFDILSLLLSNGASLAIARKDGLTPMEYFLNDRQSIRLAVLKSNANLSVKCGASGDTALHFLMRKDHKISKEVKLLISRGFNVNERNYKGVSALTEVVKKDRNTSRIEFLMKKGARMDLYEIVTNTSLLKKFVFDNTVDIYYKRVVELIYRQQGINLQVLFKELDDGSRRRISNDFLAKIVIAHLAIVEVKEILDSTFVNMKFKNDYNRHKEIVEKLKAKTVSGSVTLYKLLVDSDATIGMYTNNPDFIWKLDDIMQKELCDHSYYSVIIRERVKNAQKTTELRKKGARVFCELARLSNYGLNENHHIVSMILGYFSNQDFRNLMKIGLGSRKSHISLVTTQKLVKDVVSKVFKNIFS